MKHVNLDAYEEAVKQFVLSLKPNPGGLVLELGGQPIACILPVPLNQGADDWNSAMDARRCELIDREIAGSITAEETVELQRLQAAMLRHRRRVAPLPIDEARRLHEELLQKAAGGPSA